MAVFVPLAGALAAFGQKGTALAVIGMGVLGYLLWLGLDSRREPTRPLIVDLEGRSAKQEWSDRSARRIRVCNRSKTQTLRAVRMELVAFIPHGADFLPVELQRMNGGQQPFDLQAGTDAYLELVSLAVGSGQLVLGYDMSRVDPGTSNLVPAQSLDFVVRASADEVPAKQYLFSSSVDRRGRLQLVETTAPAVLSQKEPRRTRSDASAPREAAIAAHAVLWLADKSAWGRWQRAAHRNLHHQAGNPDAFSNESLLQIATNVVAEATRDGTLGLWGVPIGKATFVPIDPEILQTTARLRLERDSAQVWQVALCVSPTATPELAALATAYDSLAIDMEQIKELWPEYDLLTDDRTRGLSKEWKKRKRGR